MLIERPYAAQADLALLTDFLAQVRQRDPIQRWHIGDAVWRMLYSSDFDPTKQVALWEDDPGSVIGFCWTYPWGGVEFYPANMRVLAAMLDGALAQTATSVLQTVVTDHESELIAALVARGFQPDETFAVPMRRQLDAIPSAPLPEGFTLRALAGDQEVESRALAHQAAFGTNSVTIEGYRSVTHAAQYQGDLDLVVVAPDGRFAAFCLCWLDEINQVGLFEPVGTLPEFRRQGLARALMLEGLRRMQARGMTSALVTSATDNEASLALYTSLGFKPESQQMIYRSGP